MLFSANNALSRDVREHDVAPIGQPALVDAPERLGDDLPDTFTRAERRN
jgi:hypothetical protein